MALRVWQMYVHQVKAALADGTKDLISKLLAAGYVVVAPDYEGLGTPGIHPFLNVKSEAFFNYRCSGCNTQLFIAT